MNILNNILAIIKLFLAGVWTLIMSFVIIVAPFDKFRAYLCRIWGSGMLKILLVRVKMDGEKYRHKSRPIIVISNHFGLTEILAIFKLYPVRFVAKAEMGSWGPFGWAMGRSSQILINRRRKDVNNHITAVSNALKKRKNIAFFPEGTSSEGSVLLPFKSALFRALNEDNFTIPVTIQPLIITYTKVLGKKITQKQRRASSWGDEPIMTFLWELAKLTSAELTVKVLPAVEIDRPINARSLTNQLQPDMHTAFAKLTK